MNFRIGWHYDADADGTVETGTPGDDPWYWFAHDERWRIVATFRHEDSTAKERFVWHSAGLDGQGGSSYIDSVILRDKDANTAWTSASDGTLEERLYYAQNWRADVSLVLSSTGQLKERVKYSAYGVPYCISPADYNGDGAVTQADLDTFTADNNADDLRSDINFDGTADFFDYLDFVSEYNGGAGEAGGGRSSLSRASIGNRIGYAGYQWDPSIRGSITGAGGASAGKYHVRHRVLDAGQGRWTRRDPLGYVDGASVYEYVASSPHSLFDPYGLASSIGGGPTCAPGSGWGSDVVPMNSGCGNGGGPGPGPGNPGPPPPPSDLCETDVSMGPGTIIGAPMLCMNYPAFIACIVSCFDADADAAAIAYATYQACMATAAAIYTTCMQPGGCLALPRPQWGIRCEAQNITCSVLSGIAKKACEAAYIGVKAGIALQKQACLLGCRNVWVISVTVENGCPPGWDPFNGRYGPDGFPCRSNPYWW